MFTAAITTERLQQQSTRDNAPQAVGAADPVGEAFQMIGAPMRFDRDAELYGEGERAEYFYQLLGGAVRTSKSLRNGRRQIGAFHVSGDIFGLEAGLLHCFSAEALVNSTVRVARREAMMTMVERDPHLGAALWARTADDLRRAQEHMILLGRKTAEARVASFILDMAMRSPDEELVELPMSRQDIADYLGLAIETVSRVLTQLESKAAIELPTSRSINLRNRVALQRVNA